MSYSAIEIISNITPSRSVAINHHMHAVPDVQKSIKGLADLITEIESNNANGALDENIADVKAELKYKQSVLDAFLAKWPLPTITDIKDEVDLLEVIPSDWHRLTVMQSRPIQPLILRNDVKTSHVLFYQVPDSNKVLKVTNMHYNHPNKTKHIQWHF